LRSRDDLLEDCFLLRLEREAWNFSLPIDQVLKLWASCITWNFDTVIADWTGVIVVFFYLAPSNFETFAMIPV